MDCFTSLAMTMGRSSALLRRRVPPRLPDIPCRIAEPLDHDSREILGLAGDAGAGTYRVALLILQMRGCLAPLQRAGGLHHQLAEVHDAEIGGPKMFAGAIGDRALAV